MENRKTIIDIFVEGARKGWGLCINNILPNVMFAFIVIQVLKLSGLLAALGKVFGPIMGVFGLPGEAIMVLVSTFMSMGGGAGTAASLFQAGILNEQQVTILAPAIMLMGAQLQYMGRILGTSGVQTKYYPMLFGVSIVNAILSMFIMRVLS